jgi:hypothetical protein
MWTLLACACPDFTETEISDVATSPPEGARDAMQAAFDDFVAWTGREGVCVASVSLVDGVTEEAEHTEGMNRAVIGRDDGTVAVSIAADADDVYTTTLHQLCHAIDTIEGHSTANLDIFTGKGFSHDEAYDTRKELAAEGFAELCDYGAWDVGAARHIEEACAREFLASDTRYVQEQIYPDGPRAPVDIGEVPTWAPSTVVQVPPAGWVERFASVDGVLVGAGGDYDAELGELFQALFVWDDGEGSPDAKIDLRSYSTLGAEARFLLAQERAIAVVEVSFGVQPVRFVEIEPRTRALTEWVIPGAPSFVDHGVVVDDTLFLSALAGDGQGELMAFDLDGTQHALSTDDWPTVGRLDTGAYLIEGQQIIMVDTQGETSRRARPGGTWPQSSDGGAIDLGSLADAHGDVQLGLDGDRVLIPEEVCVAEPPPADHFYWNGRLAGVTVLADNQFQLWTLSDP